MVFFVVCGFSVFQRLVFAFRQKHYRDFGFGMRTGSGFSSIWAAILRLHWSRIDAKPLYAPFVTNVWDRLGFCELGCENLSVLTILQAVFGFDRFYFCFCFWQFWIIFSTVLRFLINPNAYPPPQASTTQIIRAMSHREWVTLRRIVLPFFILHAEIACSQRRKTTVHHVSSYISYAGRQLSVFFTFEIAHRSINISFLEGFMFARNN